MDIQMTKLKPTFIVWMEDTYPAFISRLSIEECHISSAIKVLEPFYKQYMKDVHGIELIE